MPTIAEPTIIEDDTEAPTENVGAELISYAKRIRAWQLAQEPKISDAAMVKRYPDLSSERTYAKLHKGTLDSLDLTDGSWIASYKKVLGLLEIKALGSGADPIYNDLAPTSRVASAVSEMVRQAGDNDRVLIIEGDTGSGKTSSLKLAHKLIDGSVLVSANSIWERSTSYGLGVILEALSVKHNKDDSGKEQDYPVSAAWRMAKIEEHLTRGQGRKLILMDEMHHAGPILDVIKGLVNSTRAYFVLAAHGCCWGKVRGANWQQVKQLIYNRTYDCIHLPSQPSQDDVRTFLTRRVKGMEEMKDWDSIMPSLQAAAKSYGSLSFLRRVAKRLLMSGDHTTHGVTNAIAVARRQVEKEGK